jgi:hypothetical protein
MNSCLRRPAVALLSTTLAASVLGLAPAAHAADGTVHGTVTGDGGPLEGVSVELYQYDATDEYWSSTDLTTYTLEDGSYSISAPPGEYRVGFDDFSGAHVPEYYDDAADVDDAETLTVVDGAGVVADAVLETAAHITGHVTLPGAAPAEGVWVVAHKEVTSDGYTDFEYARSAFVDESGNYDIGGLTAGTYRVQFGDNWFVEGVAVEYYDDQPTLGGADDLSLETQGLIQGIDAQLAPDAEIRGSVTDATDAPLADAWVRAYAKVGSEWEYVAGAFTGADGSYVLDGLPAGTYRVGFDHFTDGSLVSEYWNDKGDLDGAQDITLATDAVAAGTDAQLVAGEHDPVPLPYFTNTAAPVITGASQVGSPITATAGGWSPAPSGFEYAWYRDGEWIDGAFSATYVPTAADVGKHLTVQVAVSGDGYERTYSPVSTATAAVTPAPVPAPAPAPTPTVSVPAALAAIVADLDVAGKPKVGRTVKVTGLDKLFRSSTRVNYSFKWFAGAKKIKKATKAKLKITKAMKGRKISVKVTAKAGSTSKSVKLKVGKVR